MRQCNFYSNCVSWPGQVDDLIEMIDTNIEITRRTFLKHIDRAELLDIEYNFHYSRHYMQGLTMAADWAVSYHRSKVCGKRCYYFRHSAIEYVFI